ncbi:MAG TPA: hypothetical protein VHA74_00815, partial [Candidatus Dojkabacteria bacterium]|nr:hypothetical protein [Candidatus Dojkabacteria bacterium]
FYYYDHKDNKSEFSFSNASIQSMLQSNQPQQNYIGIDFTNITQQINSLKVDEKKVAKVHGFLQSRGSPLASKAEFLVRTAEKFGLDYRLVASISIIESSGGKFTYRPYNAWGWGGAVNPFTFSSWEDAIYTVSQGLSRYASSGLVTPAQIAPRYNPYTPVQWSTKVAHVMEQIANY